MAKTTKTHVRTVKKEQKSFLNSFEMDNVLSSRNQIFISAGIIILLFLIFFAPLFFGGKTFSSGDITTMNSYDSIREKYNGGTLWNPYIFCGLPSQFSGVGYSRWFDFINTSYTHIRIAFGNLFSNNYTQHIVFLIVLALTSFAFMRYKKATMLVSLLVGIATAFSTGIIVFVFIGHITKLYTLSMFPLVLLFLLKFQEKIKLLDFALLTIALSLLFSGWHIQVIFYVIFALIVYFIFYFFKLLKDKQALSRLFKSGFALLFAAILALGISYDIYAQMYEYTDYSTRGEKSIIEQTSAKPEDHSEGSQFYKYATDWSFSPGEVMTFIIPSYYGYGYSLYKGPLTNEQETEINTYFGQMPFVDVAMYMGVLIFFMALFAMITCWKDPFVKYLTILIVISLLISFGRTFTPIFDLMFFYFPFFDKFRVPSMILTLIQLTMPILAGIGVMRIINAKAENDQKLLRIVKYAAIGFSAVLVLSVLLSSPLKSGFTERFSSSEKGGQILGQLRQQGIESMLTDYAAGMFLSDVIINFLIVALAFWASYGYLRNKLSRDVFALILILFVVIDLFRISGRGARFNEAALNKDQFKQPDYITAIKNLNDKEPYRLMNFKQSVAGGSGLQTNYHMYFLEQVFGGYSGIKPRTYQDYVDVVNFFNPTMWRMLNIKYFIFDQLVPFEQQFKLSGMNLVFSGNQSYVYEYANTLPRVYFVDSIKVAKPLEILNAVKENSFDPKHVAYSETGISIDKPDSSAKVNITNYTNDKIELSALATGNNFMFFGDTYYPNGWKAYIDGNETKIYEVNHGFRGVIIPTGNHKVIFEYAPASYYIGKIVSLLISIFLVFGVAFGLYLNIREKKKLLTTTAEI
ncbi:MAG TPA: YfhO family protein [Ignavibacteriaceae bacterium]|nr:YfhO family protein [Ignavibacteriaceae bacterium]